MGNRDFWRLCKVLVDFLTGGSLPGIVLHGDLYWLNHTARQNIVVIKDVVRRQHVSAACRPPGDCWRKKRSKSWNLVAIDQHQCRENIGGKCPGLKAWQWWKIITEELVQIYTSSFQKYSFTVLTTFKAQWYTTFLQFVYEDILLVCPVVRNNEVETSVFLFSLQWWVWMAAPSPTRLRLKSEAKEGGRETLGLRTRRKDLRTEPRTKTEGKVGGGVRRTEQINRLWMITDVATENPLDLTRTFQLLWATAWKSSSLPFKLNSCLQRAWTTNPCNIKHKNLLTWSSSVAAGSSHFSFHFSISCHETFVLEGWISRTCFYSSLYEKNHGCFLFLSHISLRRPTLRWSSVPLRRIRSIRHPSSSAVLKAAGVPWVAPILFCSLFFPYYLTTNLFLAILSPNIFV